jgi:hypothetical protein
VLSGIDMSIQDWGSIGEFAAAIATILTLVYLAVQIRRNTMATHATSFHAISDSMNFINVAVAQNPDLARIWLSGVADRATLGEAQKHQFDLLLLSYFHVFETIYYQARKGAGDDALVTTEAKSLAALLAMPGVREWWLQNPFAFSDEYRSYVGALLDGVAHDA